MLQPLYNSTIDTTHEGDHAFVECATFADDNKYHGEMWQSDFHFKKIPYIKDGVETDYKIPVATRNLTVGMDDITMWLSGKGGDSYKDGYMYTFLMKKFENESRFMKRSLLYLLYGRIARNLSMWCVHLVNISSHMDQLEISHSNTANGSLEML